MTEALTILKSLEKRIGKIESMLRTEKANGDWIAIPDVEKDYGYKAETLRKYLRQGKLTKCKKASSGRKPMYSRKEIEKLFEL